MSKMYIKYRGDKPIKYAYGEEWVAMALFMDDYGFDTEEEAIADFRKRMGVVIPMTDYVKLEDVEEMPAKITVTVTTDDGEVIADIDGDEIICKKGYKVIMRGDTNEN